MPKHVYVVNALVEFPANGSVGRATRDGHINSAVKLSGSDLKAAVAVGVAKKHGCPAAAVKFVEFQFTEIPA
jgi:hypothetical protein